MRTFANSLISVLVLVTFSCARDPQAFLAEVSGDYQASYGDTKETLEIRKDATFVHKVYVSDTLEKVENGAFEVGGNTLRLSPFTMFYNQDKKSRGTPETWIVFGLDFYSRSRSLMPRSDDAFGYRRKL